jgi:hypothetical protein
MGRACCPPSRFRGDSASVSLNKAILEAGQTHIVPASRREFDGCALRGS